MPGLKSSYVIYLPYRRYYWALIQSVAMRLSYAVVDTFSSTELNPASYMSLRPVTVVKYQLSYWKIELYAYTQYMYILTHNLTRKSLLSVSQKSSWICILIVSRWIKQDLAFRNFVLKCFRQKFLWSSVSDCPERR